MKKRPGKSRSKIPRGHQAAAARAAVKNSPGRSNRQIAADLGVDEKVVRLARAALEAERVVTAAPAPVVDEIDPTPPPPAVEVVAPAETWQEFAARTLAERAELERAAAIDARAEAEARRAEAEQRNRERHQKKVAEMERYDPSRVPLSSAPSWAIAPTLDIHRALRRR